MAYIRCSDEIHGRLKVVAAKLHRSMQDITEELGIKFLESVEDGKSIPNSDDSGTTEKGAPPASTPAVNSGEEVQIPIPETDKPWVRKLLKVLHSPKPGLPTAVQNNLTEFVWADLAWDELRKHQSPLVSGHTSGTGQRGTTPRQFPPAAGTGEHAGGDGVRETRFTARLAAIKKSNEGREKRKKDAPGKTG